MASTARGVAKLAGLVACLLAVAVPAQAAGGRTASVPSQRSATTSAVARGEARADELPGLTWNGCPTDGPIQVDYPDQCVEIPSELPVIVTDGSGGGCVTNDYIQVQAPARFNYEAVWYSAIGLGTRWWQAPGTRYPQEVTGEGAKYRVPPGWAAWSAAGGASGSGNCPHDAPAGTFGPAGWAVISCTSPHLSADSFFSSDEQDEVGDISSVLQEQILELTQSVICHRAKKNTATYDRWKGFREHGKITTKILVPGKKDNPTTPVKLKHPVTVDEQLVDASGRHVVVGDGSLTLTETGTVTVNISLTAAGQALLLQWLDGGQIGFSTLVGAYDPLLGWVTPPALDTPPKSTDFAGYEYANYVAIPESVSASFVVPKLKCTADAERAIYPQVGVQSDTSTVGLVIGCNGTHEYDFPSLTLNNAVTNYVGDTAVAGDTIELSIAQSDSTSTLSLTDVTHKFEVEQNGSGGGTGVDLAVGVGAWNDQAEVGVPNFGTINFSNAMLEGSPFGSFGTVTSLEKYDRLTSASGGIVQISTGSFAADKTDFTTTFKHS